MVVVDLRAPQNCTGRDGYISTHDRRGNGMFEAPQELNIHEAAPERKYSRRCGRVGVRGRGRPSGDVGALTAIMGG